jgi:NAD(P)-dependent dehydrogenase (short-subunit alcohol dehydrogenase family)
MAVVLITGCSSGFGMLAALGFARAGDAVFASMRNVERAGALNDAATADGLKIDVVALDVNDDDSVRRAVAHVVERAGRIDVLVNNAGIGAVAAVEDFDDDEVRAVFETNVLGVIRCTRAVLPQMRAQRSGTIINVGSLAGVVYAPFRGIYSASKAAVEALTESLRYELLPFGIDACVIEPGFFETAIAANRMPVGRAGEGSPYFAHLRAYEGDDRTPQGSVRADPQAVADAIVAVAHDPAPKMRYAVGKDAETLVPLRRKTPDEEFEKVIRRTLPYLQDGDA